MVGAKNLFCVGQVSLKNRGSTPPQVVGFLDVF